MLLVAGSLPAEVVADSEAYEERETFESDYSYFESQRAVERERGTELIEDRVALEVRVRWTVVERADATTILRGDLISGGAELIRLSLSGGLREYDLELRGLSCKLRIADAVELGFDPEIVRAQQVRWDGKLEGVRRSQRGALMDRLWITLREVLRFPFVVARHGDRPQLPLALSYPLRAPSGKVSSVLYLDPVPRAVVGGPQAKLLWAPLRARVSTRPRASRSRLTTLVQPHRALSRLPKSKTFSVDCTGFVSRERSVSERPRGAIAYHALSVLPEAGLLEGLERTSPLFDHLHEVEFSHRLLPDAIPKLEVLAEAFDRMLPFRPALKAKSPSFSARLGALAHRKVAVRDVVERYRTLESASSRDAELTALVHYTLAEELALLAYQEERNDVRSFVEDAIEKEASEAVLALFLRALAHPYALLADADRVQLFRRVARRKEWQLARWGVRWLAASPWQGAHPALQEIRRRLAADHPLVPELDRAAFRLLGAEADADGFQRSADGPTPYLIEEIVQHPTRLDRGAVLGPVLTRLGFRRLVVSLDSSSAMREPLPQAAALVPGRAIGDSVAAEQLSRFGWSLSELTGTFASLAGTVAVGLAGFHEQTTRWKPGLENLTQELVPGAARFLKELQPGPTSVLAAAFPRTFLRDDPDGLLVIVSDGAVVSPDLEIRLALWNYLRGAVFMFVAFPTGESTTPGLGTFETAERISRREWGWQLRVARR